MAKEGRTTVYNKITSPEKMKLVNPDNIALEEDFLAFLKAGDKSKGTITQYQANIHVFWCWNLEYNKNKSWIDVKKRELIRWQNHCMQEYGWSPKRIRTVKSALSSLSKYIVEYMDDEYPNYVPIVDKISNPANVPVRKKTVYKEEDLQKILDELTAKEQYMKACYFALAMYSGRRKAELARFKVSYFTKENTICQGSLYKTPEEITTKGRGSRGKLLTVYTLARPFQPYLDNWLAERERLGITSDWLFPKYEGGKWVDKQVGVTTMDSWGQMFNQMSMRISGKPFYAHALRHFFTTKLAESNVPPSVIQNIVGWESADMVALYDDSPKDAQFDKYFGAEGIRMVKQTSLEDL